MLPSLVELTNNRWWYSPFRPFVTKDSKRPLVFSFLERAFAIESEELSDLPAKLKDCQSFYLESTELLIVEGDSASESVAAVRNQKLQAVLPIQGKPLNPLRASRNKLTGNPIYQDIIRSIGAGWDSEFDLSKRRYERIVLVFDPDADGIHCSMLVLMFFYRWMRPLLESGYVHLVRAPQFQITYDGMSQNLCSADDESATVEVNRLKAEGMINVMKKRFRGLGSMGQSILKRHCVDPATRKSEPMKVADAEAAIAVFSPNSDRK